MDEILGIKAGEMSNEESNESALKDICTPKKKILIVEDNELNMEILSMLLEEEFEILSAINGEIGLKVLAENYRELAMVLLDIRMPVCDGFEFLERVRGDALLKTVPIIVTTGSTNSDDESRCLDLGAADFITKPYNPKVVLSRVHNIINLRESVATLSVVEFDEITGHYTMPAFYHHAEEILKSGVYDDYDMFVSDIQEFKLVNSIYGEKSGDKVLFFLGNYLRSCVPDGIIARQGDKFFCLYPSEKRVSIEEFKKFVKYVAKKAPVQNLTVKYGIYKNIDKTQPVSILCDRVLMAISRVKHKLMEDLGYYDEELSNRRLRNQKMEAEFDDALNNNEFVVWFQPKIDIETEKMVGAEALVRWVDKDGNMVSPGEFITLFEQDGLIHRLDEYVFNRVCEFQKGRLKANKKIIPISVNLSRSSVYHKDTLDRYVKMVKEAGISQELVPLELTESAATEGQRIMKLALELLKLGFFLHMDDFGAGYSSLSSLGTIPFDVLKIDKSLVDQIGSQRGDIVLKHTINIAQELGMRVVAEGVEKKEQVEFLKAAGCDMIQGYFFSPPKNQESFEKILDEMNI